MSKVLTILTLTISLSLSGQDIDSLGVDKNAQLNKSEFEYLNKAFFKKRGDFNFEDKRIVFFVGNSNYRLWNKQDYFESVKSSLKNKTTIQHQLLILTTEEKAKSGGYDAFIVSWSKILVTDDQKNRLIKKIIRTRK